MNALSQILSGFRSALQWWVVLAPWEAGLRVRRGKSVTVLGAGIHLRIPFLDRFFVQSTRYRITDLPIQTLTTRDGVTVTLKGQVAYRIADIERLYDTIHSAEATIASVVLSEISRFVVTRRAEVCGPHDIEAAGTLTLQERLTAFGLADADLTITDYAKVRTYRLITQDIWSAHAPALDTHSDNVTVERNA